MSSITKSTEQDLISTGYSEVRKILVVDDDQSMRETLEVILNGTYHVITTDSGESALKILESEKGIGLVLLDIMLPGKNGIEVLREIKKRSIDAEVIIMSVVKDAEVVVEAIDLGVKDYIVKNFDYDGVLDMVGRAMKEIERKKRLLGIVGKVFNEIPRKN